MRHLHTHNENAFTVGIQAFQAWEETAALAVRR